MPLSRLSDLAKRVVKKLVSPLLKITWLSDPIRRHFYFVDFISYEQAVREGKNARNARVLIPARRVKFASPENDSFVAQARLYREGWFDQPDIFVCEVPAAYLCTDNGIVCTRDLEVLYDLEPRRTHFQNNAYKKPAALRKGSVKRLSGVYSTINYFAATSHYHWMIDCLPKIHSLAQFEPREPVTLIMPESLGRVQRDELDCVLPPNFRVEYHPAGTWLKLEKFLLPSLISGYYNGFLPPEYCESIRSPVFKRYHLPATHSPKERIYISRSRAKYRRVLNEEAVMALLEPYGFKLVEVETLSFREQVELFHRAEIVIGPSGAGFNLLMFCGKIPVVVLHPNQVPDNYFHTMAQGLGQSYHYVLHHGGHDDSFEADPTELKRVLEAELCLNPRIVSLAANVAELPTQLLPVSRGGLSSEAA
jgi:hypothetical protein